MALSLSPEGLVHELRRSLEARDAHLGEPYFEALKRFAGPAYRSDSGPSATDFENHAHSWISVFLPALASGNPRVRGRTPRLGPAAAFAKAVELALNRNFELTDIKKTIEELATDWAFKYCVAMTTPLPVAGMKEREDPPHRPTTRRLSLEDYVWDSMARSHAGTRFQGHKLARDKDSILDEADEFPQRGWNKEAVLALHEDRASHRERVRTSTSVQRNEVELWEIWIPEVTLDGAKDANGKKFQPTPEKGYHGTIFTIAKESEEFLREPRPFWGPRDGPYTFNGYLYVPDEVVPLSPLVATAAQVEMLNSVMAAAINAIRKYKRGIAVSAEVADQVAQKIAEFEDTGVFTVEMIAAEIQKHVQAVEMGGLTPQHQVQLDMLRYLVERASGISEAVQGSTSPEVTATAASIANMSTGRRMGYMTEKFIQGTVKPIAKKEAWYLAMDPRSRTSLGDLAEGLFLDPKTGQPIEMPVLEGGPDAEQGDILERMDIEIQPISMRFTSEMLEAERAVQWEQFLIATAPMIPQLPYVDWGLVYSRKAEQLGDPSLARTIDIQRAMMMGQLMLMSQLGMVGGQMATSATTAQPRLGIDIEGGAKDFSPRMPQGPTLKTSEKPGGFAKNARPGGNAQVQKGPRQAGQTASTRG